MRSSMSHATTLARIVVPPSLSTLFYFTRRYSFALNALCFHYARGLSRIMRGPARFHERKARQRDNASAIINWFRPFRNVSLFAERNTRNATIFRISTIPPAVVPSWRTFAVPPCPLSHFPWGKHENLYRSSVKHFCLLSIFTKEKKSAKRKNIIPRTRRKYYESIFIIYMLLHFYTREIVTRKFSRISENRKKCELWRNRG